MAETPPIEVYNAARELEFTDFVIKVFISFVSSLKKVLRSSRTRWAKIMFMVVAS